MNEILPANATINSDLLSDQDSGYGRDIDRIPRSRGSASRSTTPTSYQDSDYDSDIDRVLLKSQRESRKRALPDGKQRIFKRVKTSRISFELLPGEMQDMVLERVFDDNFKDPSSHPRQWKNYFLVSKAFGCRAHAVLLRTYPLVWVDLPIPCPCGYFLQELKKQEFPGLLVRPDMILPFTHWSMHIRLSSTDKCPLADSLRFFLLGPRQVESTCRTIACTDSLWRHKRNIRTYSFDIQLRHPCRKSAWRAQLLGSLEKWLWNFKDSKVLNEDFRHAVSVEANLDGPRWTSGFALLQDVCSKIAASVTQMHKAEISDRRIDFDSIQTAEGLFQAAEATGQLEIYKHNVAFQCDAGSAMSELRRHGAELYCKAARFSHDCYIRASSEVSKDLYANRVRSQALRSQSYATQALEKLLKAREPARELLVELGTYQIMTWAMLDEIDRAESELVNTRHRVSEIETIKYEWAGRKEVDSGDLEASTPFMQSTDDAHGVADVTSKPYRFGSGVSSLENWCEANRFVHLVKIHSQSPSPRAEQETDILRGLLSRSGDSTIA